MSVELLTRIDQRVVRETKESFPYTPLHITRIALERITFQGIALLAGVRSVTTLSLWSFGIVALPLYEVAALVTICFFFVICARRLVDYDAVGINGEPYFKRVRDEFELEYIAYQKLEELGVEVTDKVRVMLPNFVRRHGHANIARYGLLPAKFNEIFDYAREAMTFNDALTFYVEFQNGAKSALYQFSQPQVWSEKFIAEIYDREKQQLRMPLDEIFHRYDLTRLYQLGLFANHNELYLALAAAKVQYDTIVSQNSHTQMFQVYVSRLTTLRKEFSNRLERVEQTRKYSPLFAELSRSIEDFARKIKEYRREKDRIVVQAHAQCQGANEILDTQANLLEGRREEIAGRRADKERVRDDAIRIAEGELERIEGEECDKFRSRYSATLQKLRGEKSVEAQRQEIEEWYAGELRNIQREYSSTSFGSALNGLKNGDLTTRVIDALKAIGV